jgi:hypothetical protein
MRPYRGALRTCWATWLAALLLAATAQAATTWNVTTTLDPAVPTCPSASNCSLRGALLAAADGDTLVLPAGDYKLTQGQLTMPQPVTIDGAGAGSTTIDAQGASRVLDITTASSTPIAISDLTITGGAFTGTGPLAGGGGIYIGGNYIGAVTLTATVLTHNGTTITTETNNGGGAIYSDATAPLTLVNSTVTSNMATLTGGTSNDGGGGIYSGDGLVTLTNSHVDNNTLTMGTGSTTSNDGGGGVFSNGASVTLVDSTVNANTATLAGGTSNTGGGGIFDNGGLITLTGSQVGGNHLTQTTFSSSNNGGGGIYDNGGGTTLTGSSLNGNTASISGANNLGGLGLYANGAPATIIGSTIANNTGTAAGTGYSGGGAVYDGGGTGTYLSDTLSGNSLTVSSTGPSNGGGAIYSAGTNTLSDTTIADNTINEPGGGVFAATGATEKLKNTLLSGNTGTPAGNCASQPSAFVSDGNNLDSGDTCDLTAAGDRTNANAQLGPLQNNGGTNLTRALGPGSAAIGAGSCTDASGNPVTTDERGEPRPDPGDPAGECDIGAFEVQPTVNTVRPWIPGGPAAAGDKRACLPGSWSQGASIFTYQWNRGGAPISGATRVTYTVQIRDDATMLSCTVTAANGDGPGPPATSAPVLVGNRSDLSCPAPSGKLSGTRIGPLTLGETLNKAKRALKLHSPGPYGFTEFCLYAGFGIRAAPPTSKSLKPLPRKRRAVLKGRLVIALTPNRQYSLDGVLPGEQISAVPKRLGRDGAAEGSPRRGARDRNREQAADERLAQVAEGVHAELRRGFRPNLIGRRRERAVQPIRAHPCQLRHHRSRGARLCARFDQPPDRSERRRQVRLGSRRRRPHDQHDLPPGWLGGVTGGELGGAAADHLLVQLRELAADRHRSPRVTPRQHRQRGGDAPR